VGGLLLLLLLVLPARAVGPALPTAAQRAAMVRAFSPMALTAAAAVAVSGVLSMSMHVETPADLVATGWGRTLLGKLFCVALVVGAGWRNWKKNTPRMPEDAGASVRRGAAWELAFMTLVLLLTSSLVATSPAGE
jgi:putative copper resistance protein D